MMQVRTLAVDVAIFGGGAAGLWLLDDLLRHGYRALVLEADELGAGQTAASQGIIHGGLKYTLSGLLTASARSIREMPAVWRQCLAGEREPRLAQTRLRAPYCHLWQTRTLRSRLGMMGARAGLRIAPEVLDENARPDILRSCPGVVARLDEQVIDPCSFVADLADRHPDHLLLIDTASGLEFVARADGTVASIRLIDPQRGEPLDLAVRAVVLAAGAGNGPLRHLLGLPERAMQRRPLHMIVMRGELPELNGHCVDGAATRVTITSGRDFADRMVWQVGGRIAEVGVDLDERALVTRARDELLAVLPDLDLSEVEWSTYRVDRAEAATAGRHRPDDIGLVEERNVITGWPTKLALVPRLVEEIRRRLPAPAAHGTAEDGKVAEWTRPEAAAPPWEMHDRWMNDV